LKVLMCVVFQAYGKQVQSVSDLPRSELDRLFGEDDRPVNDREIVEETDVLIQLLKKQTRTLLGKELETAERCLQKILEFRDTRTVAI
jgi:hypothetical protein